MDMENESFTLSFTLKSASLFKQNAVANLSATGYYATASLLRSTGEPIISQKTRVDKHHGFLPFWWAPIMLQVPKSLLQRYGFEVLFEVKCRSRLISGDKTIGTSKISVRELLDGAMPDNSPVHLVHRLSSKCGKLRGLLYFSYVVLGDVAISPAVDYRCPAPSAPCLSEDVVLTSDEYMEEGDGGSSPARPAPSAPFVDEDMFVDKI